MRTDSLPSLRAVAVTAMLLVGSFAARASAQQFPEGPGKEILETQCGSCHGPEQVVSGGGRSLEEWKDVIRQMVDMGAEITKEQAETLAAYLAKNWPAKPEEPAAVRALRFLRLTSSHKM